MSNGCVDDIDRACDSATLDYNCYYVESLGYVGLRGYRARYNWTAWRALGFEAHGLNADPLVVSEANLHLLPGSPCIGTGVPIPGIETDIDGDLRDSLHPDMGADEAPDFEQEERSWPSADASIPSPTVIRGVLRLPSTSSSKSRATSLLDVAGRSVLYLYPGPNNVRYLTPGVYFVRERATASTQKVIITR